MDIVPFEKILETVPVDSFLWVVFAITLIAFGVFSAILFWHWKQYSTGKYTTATNMLIYLGVSAGFLFTMITSSIWYTLV